MGLPELIPLTPENMGKSLGPGYGRGYFAWDALTGRPDGCIVEKQKVANLSIKYNEMQNKKISTFEELVHVLTESEYHEDGHLHVGYCQGGNAPMVYSQVSARDPIFWRWHKHISNFIREMTNRILPG